MRFSSANALPKYEDHVVPGLSKGDLLFDRNDSHMATSVEHDSRFSMLNIQGTTPAWFPPAAPALATVAHLAASVIVGVCSYASALYCVWSLAGRPEGAEHFVLARARVLFARRAA